MTQEINFPGAGTGLTHYARIHNRASGMIWSTSGGTGGFEAYAAADVADYTISATEQGSSNFYTATVPTAVPAGVYGITAHRQAGGSAAEGDACVAAGDLQWNGTAVYPLSDIPVSGQISRVRPDKGVAISGFTFYLVSSADHVTPFTSGVCSGQILKDGGTFGVLQSGTITELGLGFYKVNLTSGDMNFTAGALLFTANGISGGSSDPRPFSILTQRSSGQQ